MEKQKNYKKFITLGFSTLLGIGYFPFAPGTLASLLGLGLFLLIKNNIIFLIITLIVVSISFLVSGKAEKILKRKDPKEVVIDDFAGQLLSLLFIPKKAVFILLCFLLFRAFDILKVLPADILEKKKGSLGIVGDDLVAGFYTNILIHFVILILKISS